MTQELELIESINALAQLFEAGGLQHPVHAAVLEPIHARLKAIMGRMFRRQQKALIKAITPQIRHQLTFRRSTMHLREDEELIDQGDVAQQAANHAARAILPDSLKPLIFSATVQQSRQFNTLIRKAYEDAAAQIAEENASGIALDDDATSTWLRDNSLTKLSGDLADTSVQRLRDVIADAYLKGGGYDEIVGAIKETFAGFSEYRAGVIAQTEVNSAYNAGRKQMASSLGFTQKRWETDLIPCSICSLNELAGWIGFDESFPSGDDAPVAHPNCFCSLGFRMSTKDTAN